MWGGCVIKSNCMALHTCLRSSLGPIYLFFTVLSFKDKENVGASPEKVSEKAEGGGKVEETSFSHIFRLLKQPHRLPPKMTENLSVPLALLGKKRGEYLKLF